MRGDCRGLSSGGHFHPQHRRLHQPDSSRRSRAKGQPGLFRRHDGSRPRHGRANVRDRGGALPFRQARATRAARFSGGSLETDGRHGEAVGPVGRSPSGDGGLRAVLPRLLGQREANAAVSRRGQLTSHSGASGPGQPPGNQRPRRDVRATQAMDRLPARQRPEAPRRSRRASRSRRSRTTASSSPWQSSTLPRRRSSSSTWAPKTTARPLRTSKTQCAPWVPPCADNTRRPPRPIIPWVRGPTGAARRGFRPPW